MITLVTGGSGSGKSSYAEKLFSEIKGIDLKYYLATMKVFDDEGEKKVARHRKMRSDKGFLTVEQPDDIDRAHEKMEAGRKAVLLECMSNLVANEMYRERIYTCDEVAGKILEDIKALEEKVEHLVIVTNNVFEDGIRYDKETTEYLKTLDRINIFLAERAEKVVEVVVGIPVWYKGQEGKNENI